MIIAGVNYTSGNVDFGNIIIKSGDWSGEAFVHNSFDGDNVTKDFILSYEPVSKSYVNAYITGVWQEPDSYSLSGNIITFDEAPISGTKNVHVMQAIDLEIINSNAVYTSRKEVSFSNNESKTLTDIFGSNDIGRYSLQRKSGYGDGMIACDFIYDPAVEDVNVVQYDARITNTQSNANTMNIFYASGECHLENKFGSSVTVVLEKRT